MALIDASGLMENYINSKITTMLMSKLYAKSSNTTAVPDSARQPFLYRMRVDSRVALQGAQNMKDAAALVTTAQSDVTAIKQKLIDMMEKTSEAEINKPLVASDFEMINDTVHRFAKDIADIAKNSSFNDIKLMDGSAGMDNDGHIRLQAGKNSQDQFMYNLLDKNVAAGEVLGSNGEVNFANFAPLVDSGGAWEIKDASSATQFRNKLRDIIDRITLIEDQYSYDIKALNNMSIVLQNHADVLGNIPKYHYSATSNSSDSNSSNTSSAPSSSVSDLLNGNIWSAIS